MIQQLTARELAQWRSATDRPAPVLLDVREPWELAICHIEGAVAIPLGQLGARLGELDPARPLVCVCHHGSRSQQAAVALDHAGFTDVHNLRGGIDAWADEVEPGLQRY